MATKSVKLGDKRKSSSSDKPPKSEKPTKKARSDKETSAPAKQRIASSRKAFEAEGDLSDEDDFDGLSSEDEEDGSADLKSEDDHKHKKAKLSSGTSDGKTFERGRLCCIAAFVRLQTPASRCHTNACSGQTSRESHALQKQLAQERKAAKPLADELARTKKLWERLRRKSHVPKEERQGLVDELFTIVTGRVRDFVLKHDAVRAVQTAIKYATMAQRREIAQELKGTFAQLAESRYAKFLIGKLLGHQDDEVRDLIVPEFYGKVKKLINHPEASWILDDIYRGVATKEQKDILLREWYGTEFALFKPENGEAVTADLPKILKNEPSKRGPILKYLFGMINNLIQKQMTGFTMLHDAMLQYFLCLPPDTEEHKEFVEIIKADDNGDLLKNLAFTRSGARLVCLLLAYGGAKDRKQILKTYKDTFELMCGDRNAHAVILTAFDVIDDTVLTSKSILPEILGKSEDKEAENVFFCVNNPNARIVIRYPFEGTSKSLFPPSHWSDLGLLKEVHAIRKNTSKKDPEVRRKEIVAAMSPALLRVIASSAKDIMSTSFGCQMITEVLLSAVGDKTEALNAVAATAEGDPNQEPEENPDSLAPPRPHPARDPFAARMYKTLVSGGHYDKASGKVKAADPPLNFANTLYDVIKSHIVAWATGPGSFVPVGLLEAEDFEPRKAELVKTLKKNKKLLEKASIEETAEQKAKREALAAVDSEEGQEVDKAAARKGRKDKRKGAKKELLVGNAGAKILLEKL